MIDITYVQYNKTNGLVKYVILQLRKEEMREGLKEEHIKFKDVDVGLEKTQLNLRFTLRKYENLHKQLSVRAKIGYDNNQHLINVFIRLASISFKPIEFLSRFLEDSDIFAVAATCQTLYRFIYSPLGYHLLRSLRPPVIKIIKEIQMPTFNQSYLQTLCNDINLINFDEDDKLAVIQTMKTNLMAARQKIKQMEKCNVQWQRRKTDMKQKLHKVAVERDNEQKRIYNLQQQVEKLNMLLQRSTDNICELNQVQQKMINEREARNKDLQTQKERLTRQKELLIKKIKSQQKERQESLIYTRQVNRIIAMLGKLTTKK